MSRKTPKSSGNKSTSSDMAGARSGGLGPNTAYTPQPNDAKLTRSSVNIKSTDMQIAETFPLQVSLRITGTLPTHCHQLRAVLLAKSDAKQRIDVEVYAVHDTTQECPEQAQAFNFIMPLGSFSGGGKREVLLNSKMIGSFNAGS